MPLDEKTVCFFYDRFERGLMDAGFSPRVQDIRNDNICFINNCPLAMDAINLQDLFPDRVVATVERVGGTDTSVRPYRSAFVLKKGDTTVGMIGALGWRRPTKMIWVLSKGYFYTYN